MEKFTSITFNWILVLFFIALTLIILPATELFSYWDIDWGKVSIDLGYGILIGLIPSVLIAVFKSLMQQRGVLGFAV